MSLPNKVITFEKVNFSTQLEMKSSNKNHIEYY